jgi:hypothetical protein
LNDKPKRGRPRKYTEALPKRALRGKEAPEATAKRVEAIKKAKLTRGQYSDAEKQLFASVYLATNSKRQAWLAINPDADEDSYTSNRWQAENLLRRPYMKLILDGLRKRVEQTAEATQDEAILQRKDALAKLSDAFNIAYDSEKFRLMIEIFDRIAKAQGWNEPEEVNHNLATSINITKKYVTLDSITPDGNEVIES